MEVIAEKRPEPLPQAQPVDALHPGRVWSYWPTSRKHLEYYEGRMLSRLRTPFRTRLVPISVVGTPYEINTVEVDHFSAPAPAAAAATQTEAASPPPPSSSPSSSSSSPSSPSSSFAPRASFHPSSSAAFTTLASPPPPTPTCSVPLVLIHGFGGGLAVFVKNFDDLARHFPKVYAFDTLGFGRSSRPRFPTHEQEVEDLFVESIEAWRAAVGLPRMVLLGHSFGGYQAAAYALRYPQHVQHLILADPWGFPVCPPNPIPRRIPWWARGLVSVLRHFAPFSFLRAIGPLGPWVLPRVRPDIGRKYADTVNDPDTFYQYVYHLNVQQASGELGFQALISQFAYAKMPMIERIGGMSPSIPISFIYGELSWMDRSCGAQTRELLPQSRIDVHVVPRAGHHVICDDSTHFNNLVARIAEDVGASGSSSA